MTKIGRFGTILDPSEVIEMRDSVVAQDDLFERMEWIVQALDLWNFVAWEIQNSQLLHANQFPDILQIIGTQIEFNEVLEEPDLDPVYVREVFTMHDPQGAYLSIAVVIENALRLQQIRNRGYIQSVITEFFAYPRLLSRIFRCRSYTARSILFLLALTFGQRAHRIIERGCSTCWQL